MSQEEPGDPRHPAGVRFRHLWRTGPVWMASDRTLARFVGRPIAAFLHVEAAGGIVLLAAALVALVWANSPWSDSYDALWTAHIDLRVGGFELVGDVRHWVNDALMVIFFLVVGLEIKYELAAGELHNPKAAALPMVAAFGGMVVPAAIYMAFNAGGGGSVGWGIPMATDIAFALGVVGLLGRRIPSAARVFLLTLAIVDDIGAITVIAVFYTTDLSLGWLATAALGLAAVVVLRTVRVWSIYPYVILGILVWLATYESGVHATIAGVAMGLLCPAKPLLNQQEAREHVWQSAPQQLDARELRRYRFLLGESVPVAERLADGLHPWSSYVVLPIFALGNAGVDLTDGAVADAVGSSVTLGVCLGLVFGKTIGVLGASWLSVRTGLGQLPTNTTWGMVAGLAVVAGVGFTVSLFITELAFGGAPQLAAEAKVGILAGSLVAACVGAAILAVATRRRDGPPEGEGSD